MEEEKPLSIIVNNLQEYVLMYEVSAAGLSTLEHFRVQVRR